ncbi:MAG: RNA-binding protein 5, partial [Paramarteilia canceri]
MLQLSSNQFVKANASELIQNARHFCTSVNSMKQVQIFPEPDMTNKHFDSASGYYYDDTTGFYYEPKSKFFYNPMTQRFMIYDYNKKTYTNVYVPVNTGAEINTQNDTSSNTLNEQMEFSAEQPNLDEKPIESSDTQTQVLNNQSVNKNMQSSKIAKDMERWAKRQNSKTNSLLKSSTEDNANNQTNTSQKSTTNYQNIGMTLLANTMQQSIMLENQSPLAVNSLNSLDNNENEQSALDKLIDWTKLDCLLCQRRFKNKKILQKHIKKSDLHLTNLAKWHEQSQGQ